MKMKEIIATPATAMKKKEKKQFIILGPRGSRVKEEEEDTGVEKILCDRCKRKTEGKDFCMECGRRREINE